MLNRAALTDTIAFWETGRLGYNAVLAAAVFVVATVTDGWLGIGRQWLLIVALGAVANVLYCAAYPFDLVAKLTPLAAAWRAFRPVAWGLGTALSLLIATAVLFGLANGRPI